MSTGGFYQPDVLPCIYKMKFSKINYLSTNALNPGEFIARIWNQTTTVGTARTLEQFVEACQGPIV